MIEFRDIFIAATCIVNELPLITLNKKHFKRIEELKLI
jgi:tRNA(fMet)-specific endonuclease VapC